MVQIRKLDLRRLIGNQATRMRRLLMMNCQKTIQDTHVHYDPPGNVILILFIILFFAFSYVHQLTYRSSTPVSRLNLLHSLVLRGTFRIDSYHENTSNKSIHHGHYYSDKAPGVTVLALPAFALAVGVLDWLDIPLDSDVGWLASSWIACSGSLGIIAALGGVALFVWLCEWVPPKIACITTLALFLGAAPLIYCTLMVSHGLVVGLLAISLWAANFGRNETRPACRVLNWRVSVTGVCCGVALASEYSSGIVVVAILGWLAISDCKRIFSLALGAIPALMLIPAYHWICFGTPFTVAYLHEAVFTQMHEGFFGINFPPKAEAAYSLLFSSRVGLFSCSPVLLLSFVGYCQLYAISRAMFWIAYLVPFMQVVAISGYFLPEGGMMYGPRFLAPILVILSVPTALGIARFPRLGYLLASASIVITVLVTVVDIAPVPRDWPLVEFYLASFIQGRFSPNLGTVLGLERWASLAPLLLFMSVGIWLVWRLLPRHTNPDRFRFGAGNAKPSVIRSEEEQNSSEGHN